MSTHKALASTTKRDIEYWLLVLSAMTADIVLTLIGLGAGLIELNPIALFGINTFGYAILAFLKVPALMVGFYGWVMLPPPMRRLNLIGLAVPWCLAVMVNTWLIFQTLQ